MTNPIATPTQARLEQLALRVMADPRMQATIADRRQYWLENTKPGADMPKPSTFISKKWFLVRSSGRLNCDPLRPEVVTITRIPHELDGQQIPGSRAGLDNPDSVYRVIPISGHERYLIRGRAHQPRLTENYFTLWDGHMGTVDVLDGSKLELDSDGSFIISVDAQAAGDRLNHIRSSPEAVEFYIRDVIADWSAERPNELTIERLGEPTTTPELTFDGRVSNAQKMLIRNIDSTMRWTRKQRTKPQKTRSISPLTAIAMAHCAASYTSWGTLTLPTMRPWWSKSDLAKRIISWLR